MAEIHFSSDQRLFNQSGSRILLGGGAQIERVAIEKGGNANFLVDLRLGDHLVGDGDGDTVDDFGEKRAGKKEYEEDEEYREGYRTATVREWPNYHQNACPSEK